MRRYWRVTFRDATHRLRRVWAVNYNDPGAGHNITFYIVNKEGEQPDPRELVIAAPTDVETLEVATMNKKYAWLEVVTNA